MNKKEGMIEWSKLYGGQISEAEYDDICHNLGGFFEKLKEWDRKDNSKIEKK